MLLYNILAVPVVRQLFAHLESHEKDHRNKEDIIMKNVSWEGLKNGNHTDTTRWGLDRHGLLLN